MRLSQGPLVKDVHLVVGVLAIAVNALAGAYGTWCWLRVQSSVWFWRLLRAGQGVVVLQVALGGVLVLIGHKPPGLHVLYGVLPLLVSVIAEPLRASSAQMILDARGYESAQAVGKLPQEEQRGIVMAIIRRELGLMTIAAWVVVVLLLRAAQTAG
jgi:hypothetical protein